MMVPSSNFIFSYPTYCNKLSTIVLSTFIRSVNPKPHAFTRGAIVTSNAPLVFSEVSIDLLKMSIKTSSATTSGSFLLMWVMIDSSIYVDTDKSNALRSESMEC